MLDSVAAKHCPFSLFLKGLGQFPRGNKKILWVGLEDSNPLKILQRDLEELLELKGYQKEDRKYNPHITLGREVLLQEEWSLVQRGISIEALEVRVSKITLMESARIKGKLTYVPRYSKELQS